jgi:hypothetical protein
VSEGAVVRPLLTVVRGGPTPEQLAALVAVVTARASAAETAAAETAAAARPLWAAPVLRSPLSHGPGAWRASGLPR